MILGILGIDQTSLAPLPQLSGAWATIPLGGTTTDFWCTENGLRWNCKGFCGSEHVPHAAHAHTRPHNLLVWGWNLV